MKTDKNQAEFFGRASNLYLAEFFGRDTLIYIVLVWVESRANKD